MHLTDEQREPIRRIVAGSNVAVQAIPGAGKTALIVEACRRCPKPCLVLVYNTQLSAAVQAALDEGGVQDVLCCTMHALCSRCLAPARDDAAMHRAVCDAKEGRLVPHDVPVVARCFIDEAQDARETYVELLRVLELCAPHVPTMVAGDVHQLIYDFDADFPASKATLVRPDLVFKQSGDWARLRLSCSHRLTRPMAALANAMFEGVHIQSVRDDGPPIRVHATKAFQMMRVLEDVLLLGDEDAVRRTMLLVARRRGNKPLCKLLNALSVKGQALHVHGFDADDATHGKLRCSTWWAAKGMQCDTAVVLVPRYAPRNPCYVALTRACRQLVLVVDEAEPNAALCRALAALPREHVHMDGRTAHLVASVASHRASEDSFQEQEAAGSRPGSVAPRGVRSLDAWRAPLSVKAACRLDQVPGASGDPVSGDGGDDGLEVVHVQGRAEGAVTAARRTALVAAEWSAMGRVRAMEDMLHPTRLDTSMHATALAYGLVARPVHPSVSEDALLASDLRSVAEAAYRRMDGVEDMAQVALAALAWDSYDHVMRQLLPVGDWVHHAQVQRAVDHARALLPNASSDADVDYDTCLSVPIPPDDATLSSGGGAERDSEGRGDESPRLKVRADAVCARASFVVVWGEEMDAPSLEVVARAALCAAMHPSHTCIVVDLLHGWTRRVSVDHPARVLSLVA